MLIYAKKEFTMSYYLIAFIFYFITMIITFYEPIRKTNYYFYISLILNTCGSICWFLLVKYLDNNEEILIHSAYWDLMILIICFLFPIIIFNFNFNLYQMIGFLFILLGFGMVKWFHNI